MACDPAMTSFLFHHTFLPSFEPHSLITALSTMIAMCADTLADSTVLLLTVYHHLETCDPSQHAVASPAAEQTRHSQLLAAPELGRPATVACKTDAAAQAMAALLSAHAGAMQLASVESTDDSMAPSGQTCPMPAVHSLVELCKAGRLLIHPMAQQQEQQPILCSNGHSCCIVECTFCKPECQPSLGYDHQV